MEEIVNKKKKGLIRRIDEALDGEILSSKAAKKLRNPDDPDVKILESKNQYIRRDGWYKGESCRNRSWYLYEPYARYKRKENPEYKRYKDYSLKGTLAGLGLLVTGFASGNLPFAYAGAALALTSVGYLSGHSLRRWAADERFEKVPWPEEGVQEKLEEAKAKDKGMYQSLKQWITDNVLYHIPIPLLQKQPWHEARWREQDKEPKDEGLHIRRTHKTHEIYGRGSFSHLEWRALNEPKFSQHSKFLGIGIGSLALGGLISLWGAYLSFAPLVYMGATTPLYALGHYAGFIFGKKRAQPEYQKVGDLENKVKSMQGTYGSIAPAQPKNGEFSKYEKELKK